jgi:hypothetical protein
MTPYQQLERPAEDRSVLPGGMWLRHLGRPPAVEALPAGPGVPRVALPNAVLRGRNARLSNSHGVTSAVNPKSVCRRRCEAKEVLA